MELASATVSCQLIGHQGTLIPAGEEVLQFEVEDTVSWVLIVEKEACGICTSKVRQTLMIAFEQAVFQTLCQLRLTSHPSLPGYGIMITGKGYPDVATRQLVKSLSDNLAAVYGLAVPLATAAYDPLR